MKIVTLVGARPQYIKEAALHQELKKRGIEEVLVNSGQHYDFNMSDVFFKTLNIKSPEYNLRVGSGSHGEMTGKIMIEFEKVVETEKPDAVVVFGDTNTTLAGAIVTSKMKIKLAHVEAGLRMFPKDMPEEINRVLTDHIADFLFCPSLKTVQNLKKEGITKGVHFTGDITYDLFLKMKPQFKYGILDKYGLKENEYIVVTMHRDYNVDNRDTILGILKALKEISQKTKIVFPMHPRTSKRIKEFELTGMLANFIVTEPIEYLDLMGLVSKSQKVITDSGGLQKEAYFAGKMGLVLMPDTGWVELLEHEYNYLCDSSNLVQNAIRPDTKEITPNLYGQGNAGEKMVNLLIESLND